MDGEIVHLYLVEDYVIQYQLYWVVWENHMSIGLEMVISLCHLWWSGGIVAQISQTTSYQIKLDVD